MLLLQKIMPLPEGGPLTLRPKRCPGGSPGMSSFPFFISQALTLVKPCFVFYFGSDGF